MEENLHGKRDQETKRKTLKPSRTNFVIKLERNI